MANTYDATPTHGASAVAPAITLFSTGGGSSAGGPATKTTGGTAAAGGRGTPAGGYGPLDDNVIAAMADELSACEEKTFETNSQVKRETLGALRALEKEITKDDWMYSKPRTSL